MHPMAQLFFCLQQVCLCICVTPIDRLTAKLFVFNALIQCTVWQVEVAVPRSSGAGAGLARVQPQQAPHCSAGFRLPAESLTSC